MTSRKQRHPFGVLFGNKTYATIIIIQFAFFVKEFCINDRKIEACLPPRRSNRLAHEVSISSFRIAKAYRFRGSFRENIEPSRGSAYRAPTAHHLRQLHSHTLQKSSIVYLYTCIQSAWKTKKVYLHLARQSREKFRYTFFISAVNRACIKRCESRYRGLPRRALG